MEDKEYDLIIIGAGPAGLTAAVYAGRYLLKTLVIGKLLGGSISEAHLVNNFPTHISINGLELTKKLADQVKKLNIEIIPDEVLEIAQSNHFNENKSEHKFIVKTDSSIYYSKKIIVAIGRKKRKLDVKGEDNFLGKGVSYCATCDCSFFKDKTVCVVGGSNSALTAALLLADYAKKVYIIYRKDRFFRAEPAWIKQVENNKKIQPIFNSNIEEIFGDKLVNKIRLNDGREIPVDGVFVEIGFVPDRTLPDQLKLELKNGYIVVDKNQRTSMKGVFAAGDITNNPLKQAITACGEGAIASSSAYQEIIRGE